MIITLPYIWCTKPGMTCTNDVRVASLNDIHHHRPQAWETNGGNWGTLAYLSRQGPDYQFLNFRSPGCGTVGST